ncbi:hypothetical protein AMTR_s00032p00228800 [Amborella trichopoda]|uniref:Uncharacterized protein n=1 Tax=Amborella trichopoda TaxID=13333 RepID=U5D0T5_AMBTC|nr:hypothetical protein AMTR_s00032p00228800 [Amborella trichopoda]
MPRPRQKAEQTLGQSLFGSVQTGSMGTRAEPGLSSGSNTKWAILEFIMPLLGS